MLDRLKLKEVRQRHQALLQKLSVMAATDAPQEVKTLMAAKIDLEKLPELDALSDCLSLDYIQSIRDKSEIAALQDEIKQEVLDGLFDRGEFMDLLHEASSINADLARLESTVKVVEALKQMLQEGVKEVLNAYYQQQKSISEKAIEGIKTPKGLFSRPLPPEQKEKKIAALIAQPREKVQALFGEALTKDKPVEMLAGKMQLSFSSLLDEMALTDLIQYANKVIQVTDLFEPLLSLAQKKVVDDQVFSDYFSCDPLRKKECIVFIEHQKKLIDRDEGEFKKYTEQLAKHEANKGKKAAAIKHKIEGNVIPAAIMFKKRIVTLKGVVLREANDKYNQSKIKFWRTQGEFNIVEKNIEIVKQDSQALEQLLQQQEKLLKSARETKACRQNQEAIETNARAIVELRAKISLDVVSASNMMAVVLEFLKEQSQWFHGNFFQNLKKQYKTTLIPRYNAAVKAASQHRALDAEEKEFFKELKNEKQLFELQQKKRQEKLAQMQAAEKRSHQQAPVREKELKTIPALSASMKVYENQLEQINTGCSDIGNLSFSIARLNSQVDASSKDMEKKTLSSLQILQGSLSTFSAELQNKMKQLEEKRADVAKVIADLNNVCGAASTKIKKTENYKEFQRQFELAKERFNRPGTYVASKEEGELSSLIALKATRVCELISDKQLNLVNELKYILEDIFSEKNLKDFWRKQVSYPGRMVGEKVKVRNDRGLFKPISVPRAVYGACAKLRPLVDNKNTQEKQKEKSNEKMITDICLSIKARLAVDPYGRTKSTKSVYSAIAGLLDDKNRLVLSEEKLEKLESLFDKLVTPNEQRSSIVARLTT